MPRFSEIVKIGNSTMLVCGSARYPRCSFCGKRGQGEKQCDFPLNSSKTCDAYFCTSCGEHIEPNTDYCPIHKGRATKTETVESV